MTGRLNYSSFYIFFRFKIIYRMRKICTFATDSGFPKRTTFQKSKRKKFPKTDNSRWQKWHKH